jgi:hypothetical protein
VLRDKQVPNTSLLVFASIFYERLVKCYSRKDGS